MIRSGTKWVSGGIVRSGWASSIIRSSVVPERFMPTTNGTGSRRASSLFSFESNPMVSGYASSELPATPPKRFEPLSPRARSPGVFDRAHSSGGIQFSRGVAVS